MKRANVNIAMLISSPPVRVLRGKPVYHVYHEGIKCRIGLEASLFSLPCFFF